MKRRTPPTDLTAAFREAGLARYMHCGPGTEIPLRLYDGGPACWLWQFDPLERPCSGRLEVFHVIGRKEIRRILRHQLMTDLWADGAIDPLDVDDLVELAEWDSRNAGPGCEGHHRRLDSQATPALEIPASHLWAPNREFILEWGFLAEAERKFPGAHDLFSGALA